MTEVGRVFEISSLLPDQAIKPAVGRSPIPRRNASQRMRKRWKKLAEAAWGDQKPIAKARVTYLLRPARRGLGLRSYCAKDRDNARSAAKPALDGIVDAGVLLNDSHHTIVEDPVEWGEETAFGRLTIRVEELL